MQGQRPAIVLALDSEGFQRLEDSLRLASLQEGRAAPQEWRVRRFDSPTFDLAAQGIGLALAEPVLGDAARSQVVTSESVRFGRWVDVAPPGSAPDATLLASRGCVGDLQAAQPFAIENLTRTTYLPTCGHAHCRIDLESGSVEGQNENLPVYRAVLSGAPSSWSRLVKLARLLVDQAPCDLLLNEAALALDLVQGSLWQAKKSRRLGLRGVDTPEHAFRLIARQCLWQIAANRPIIVMPKGDTVEGVHQMRVGVRRLRSAINLFRPLLKPAPAQRSTIQLKELASLLGPVRDSDVFCEIILDPVLALLPDHEGLTSLSQKLKDERELLLAKALAPLEACSFARRMLDLQDWSETGVIEEAGDLKAFAAQALDKRHKKLMKAGRDFLNLDPTQRHQLRIRGKKMRYAAEFLYTLFAESKSRRYLESLTHLVDVLGHLNDIAVARRGLAERLGGCDQTTLHHGIGFIEGWHAGRAALLETQAVAAWNDFKRQDRFWK
jgi:CHAD domain-containing protein